MKEQQTKKNKSKALLGGIIVGIALIAGDSWHRYLSKKYQTATLALYTLQTAASNQKHLIKGGISSDCLTR